ncbi:MAG: hypothetical protein NTY47_05870 [Candidatus Omnitrophica bacterium]|nr:hypothetical protein [Candidatus Omnitrophota bacterium]
MLYFAQASPASTAVLRVCKGTVESISVANPKTKAPAEITVLDRNGQSVRFVVKPGTTISDKDDKAPSLGKIDKKDNVIIEYSTTKEGVNIASSIKSVE